MSLKARLVAEIAAIGPISVAEYMLRCLHDPQDGYYATRPAIGEAGDFITAPAVSQMFGELIGLWLAETWRRIGEPASVVLAEAGPGDGALISDVLRAAAAVPGFGAACEVWLVEVSAPLRALQARRLATYDIRWAASVAELPADRPLLLVANEFLDCLPLRQYQRTDGGWAERVVGLSEDGELTFGLRPAQPVSAAADVGDIVGRSPAQEAVVSEIAHRIGLQGGVALLIDYGSADLGVGDTLQALARHRKVDPLDAPGTADLTAHVDFPNILAAARAAGAHAALTTQGEFLQRLGVEARAAALAKAQPQQAQTLARQLDRLVAADQMGELFKALAIWSGAPPPVFEDLA